MYTDCTNHHFHIPVYSRVIIRDCDDFSLLKNGKVGLVNLITPMICATPILSVMTDDLGVAPDSIKTCAAGASEILSETVSALKGESP